MGVPTRLKEIDDAPLVTAAEKVVKIILETVTSLAAPANA
jgi:hypothetical protein